MTTIRPASEAVGTVTAAGNLELVRQHQAVLKVGGVVDSVNVEVGDQVKAGDVLVVLDGTDLERSVADSLLDLATAQNALDDLLAAADPAQVAVAEANLLSAQENSGGRQGRTERARDRGRSQQTGRGAGRRDGPASGAERCRVDPAFGGPA